MLQDVERVEAAIDLPVRGSLNVARGNLRNPFAVPKVGEVQIVMIHLVASRDFLRLSPNLRFDYILKSHKVGDRGGGFCPATSTSEPQLK